MANRILRDYTDSQSVNVLDWFGECLFVRLIQKADDYGRFYRNPAMIRSLLFPLKRGLRIVDIDEKLTEMEQAGLLRSYEIAGKPILEIVKFKQRMRSNARFPNETGDFESAFFDDDEETAETLTATRGGLPQVADKGKKETEKEKRRKKEKDKENIKELSSVCNINTHTHVGACACTGAHAREAEAIDPAGEGHQCPDQTLEPNPELWQAAEEIQAIHPRKRELRSDIIAIADAIQRESEKPGQTLQSAIKRIKTATEEYAAAVSRWPLIKRCFIKPCKNWFEDGCYFDDPEMWKQFNGDTKPKFNPRDPSTWNR